MNPLPTFHDAQIVGIRLLEEGNVEISLLTEAGKRCALILHSVARFRCDNFREGNIVLDFPL